MSMKAACHNVDYEFHISRESRDRYQINDSLFSIRGNVVIADFSAARHLAERMSRIRNEVVPPGEIYALGLIDEINHVILREYQQHNPRILERAYEMLGEDLHATLLEFSIEFPPTVVYKNEISAQDFLNINSKGKSNRVITLVELLLLQITNENQAIIYCKELIDNKRLKEISPYSNVMGKLELFLVNHKGMVQADDVHKQESIFDILRAPARIAPDSLSVQLEYLLNRWKDLLGSDFLAKLLRGMDFLKEEQFHNSFSQEQKSQSPVISYSQGFDDEKHFSPDKDWMPRLVLIAKNSFVWLDQLSKKYQRSITRLDQIPNEELVTLQERGVTGLWLIGLWERSKASLRIKQIMGQPDAAASAYSLLDYQISADLGGWESLDNLRKRAWEQGIRLSADMVPNHMGIDSKWVIEHPDWFLSVSNSPFPNYSFNSPNLSDTDNLTIQIEDHYYDRSDAAVVFKRLDRINGDTSFIYHGNDGTSMPWNDTAQLDFTKSTVREAVIQTILHVARNFPIIRFDAAMTLAKRHIQRLWFPEPGSGGAIPSRSEHGVSKEEFNSLIPKEFWREVVDRVALEAPDTLLLAEAFWLMEGYFVRTLGMHRVYNSAFMHMLRDEENANYRQVLKNTIEFDPQVLKRYVNFMNNPDEKSAAEQFGTTEKYFGVCTMLLTLPGLPMFGHGQFEGFREKYGMEFRKAKWDEQVDEGLLHGHELRIFPLIHIRSLFADVENFYLYDFYLNFSGASQYGNVNEDVFAYSNMRGNDRALIVYNNKYSNTRGWIKLSSAFMDPVTSQLAQKTIGHALNIPEHGYAIFTDFVTGLEYIRSCKNLHDQGLNVEIGKYQAHVFLNWRFTDEITWKLVCEKLDGAGTQFMELIYKDCSVVSLEASKEIINQEPKKPIKSEISKKNKTTKNRNLQ